TPRALVTCRQEHVQRSFDVDGAGRQRVLNRARYRGQSALVEDDFDSAHRAMDTLVAPELTFHHLDLSVQFAQIGSVAGREVVDDANLIAPLEQGPDEVRPDESCS